MPAECKYCGEPISVWRLLGTKVLTGSFPECPGCGADDDTLEIRAEAEESMLDGGERVSKGRQRDR